MIDLFQVLSGGGDLATIVAAIFLIQHNARIGRLEKKVFNLS